MPTSHCANISPIVAEIARLAPTRILDLGIGGGKYGVLCRDYLDICYGRYKRADWATEIIGIDAFPAYENPAWGSYNTVHIGDFLDLAVPLCEAKPFDLVLFIDALEHIEKPQGGVFLARMLELNKRVIVSVPEGMFEQGAALGNEYERHRAAWYLTDLKKFSTRSHRVLLQDFCSIISLEGQK